MEYAAYFMQICFSGAKLRSFGKIGILNISWCMDEKGTDVC